MIKVSTKVEGEGCHDNQHLKVSLFLLILKLVRCKMKGAMIISTLKYHYFLLILKLVRY